MGTCEYTGIPKVFDSLKIQHSISLLNIAERGGSAEKMSKSGDEVNTEEQESPTKCGTFGISVLASGGVLLSKCAIINSQECPEVEENMLEITLEVPEEVSTSDIEINEGLTEEAPTLEILLSRREGDENASDSAKSKEVNTKEENENTKRKLECGSTDGKRTKIEKDNSLNLCEKNELKTCAICLDSFMEQDLGYPDCCKHVFCFDCIERWAVIEYSCPIDRKFVNVIVRKTWKGRMLQTKFLPTLYRIQFPNGLRPDSSASDSS
ncbi:hypothetical protein CDAR_487051 [Caerostris darwini]|uniref:RING-type domain-containing protein n=1 Tax=Caerostris darwini TaxID=1538125 RepID=A0AAV4TGZ4_9ARAC|nr:hypothetical protein CDAR_487051 [Caerostris darwini]